MTAPLPEHLKPAPETGDVLLGVRDGVGHLRLNRPKAINALSTAMCRAIHAALDGWATDDEVRSVQLTGEGERGLCSGGDVRAARQFLVDGDPERAVEFFETEYAMNAAIAAYPKPYRALLQGVTMGGGLGVSALNTRPGSERLVTADVQVAMPESIIGFFPDVGITWLLARAPRELGLLMAITGRTINATDAITVGLADALADGESAPEGSLPTAAWVEECLAGDDAAAMVARLEAHDDPDARAAAEEVRQRSPLAVHVAVRAIREAAGMTMDEVLARDLVLARAFCDTPDFLEGVRAQLVDKDRTPTWTHARVEDVSVEEVDAFWR